MIRFYETELSREILKELIRLSAEWESENSCYGYRKNEESDITGNRIFLAEADGGIVGYLFGHPEKSKNAKSIMPENTDYFEIEELYVRPEYRSREIGSSLFRFVEKELSGHFDFIMLSTATKNWKAILHFYIEELGMDFWSARLYKKLGVNAFPETGPVQNDNI